MDLFTIAVKADTSPLVKGKKDLDNFSKGAKGVTGQAKQMTRSVMGATAAIAAFLATSRTITTITSFEDSLLSLKAVSSATTAQMADFEKQARSLGATSIYTAGQVADAQKNLAMAGFDYNKIMSATPAVLNLATAAELDLASAADIATNVLGGFRLEVGEFNKVGDILANTARNGNTDVRQLAEGLSYAAPIAASAGISISETSAALASLADNALKGSRGGTGLTGFIRQLSKVTPEAEKALSKYGLTTEDVNIQNRGLLPVLKTLEGRITDVGDQFTIFGSEAGVAAGILTNTVSNIEALNKKNEEAVGAMEAMADTIGSGLSAAFKGFNSQVGESILQLGDSGLTEALKDATEGATGLLSVYNGMDAAFAETNKLTKEQHDSLIDVAEAIRDTTEFLALSTTGYILYANAGRTATAVTLAFNAALRVNPLTAVLSTLALAATAFYSFSDSTDTATESMEKLADETGRFNKEQKDSAIINLTKKKVELEEKLLEIREQQLLTALPDEFPSTFSEKEIEMARNRHGANSAISDDYLKNTQEKIKLIEDALKGFKEEQILILTDSPIIPNIASFNGSESVLGIAGYTDEIARLTNAYSTLDAELVILQNDESSLMSLMKIASSSELPALEDALVDVRSQMDAINLANSELNDPFRDWSSSLGAAANSMSQFIDATDESGKSTAKLQVAMAALNAVQAINAVINQSGGDPYTAFGRMAAMASIMASLGSFGISLGGLSGSNSDTSAAAQETQGTGSVLGSIDEKSESISNSLDLIETINDSLLGVNQSMLNELKNLNSAITGTSNQISQNVSFDGLGQLGNFSANPLKDFNPLSILGDVFDFGGMLGGSSSVTNEGINIVGGTIADIVNNTTALAFQEVKTKKYAWSSSKTKTYTAAVASSVEAQFDSLYTSIVDTVAAGASAIGVDDGTISNALSSFIFESIDISLKGLDADGKTAALEAVFSRAFDNLASSMLPFLSEFQNAGEGFGETMSRISTELAVAQKAADRLGQSINQGVVGNIRLADIMSEVSGGVESLATNISGFTDNFYSSSEQAAFLLSDLNGVLESLGTSLPMTEAGFRALVEAQDLNTQAGASNVATLLDLQDEASEYYSLLEDANGSILDFVRELMGLAADGTQTLASAQSAYENAIAAARAGDDDARAELSSLAQTYLDLVGDNASTSLELRAAQQSVINQLTGLTGTVPSYANGTDYHAGGWAMVGEQGPELVNLPMGSSVKTNSETNGIMNQAAVVDAVNRLISLTNGGFSVLAKNSKVMADYMEVWDNEGLPINSATPIRVETV